MIGALRTAPGYLFSLFKMVYKLAKNRIPAARPPKKRYNGMCQCQICKKGSILGFNLPDVIISSLILSVLNQVIDMRFCSCFRNECFVFSFFQYHRNFAFRVVEVAKIHALCGTNRDTSRLLAFLNPMNTECAFINVTVRMRISCIVRTACNTGAAANAFVVSYSYNSTCFVMTCSRWAASYAWRVFAVVATFGADFNFELRVSSVGYFHYPVAAIPYRNVIFGLAGNHTIRAAYTFFSINCHRVSHDCTSLSFSNLKVTKLPLIPVPPIIGSIKTRVISCESLAPLPKARLNFLSE